MTRNGEGRMTNCWRHLSTLIEERDRLWACCSLLKKKGCCCDVGCGTVEIVVVKVRVWFVVQVFGCQTNQSPEI
jgi:hypothetical protein